MPYLGLDLTDPYASKPRGVDVAIVDDAGRCDFTLLPPVEKGSAPATWLRALTTTPDSGDVLVIDGPLGLAAEGGRMRECERLLGTPGKTADELPEPGTKRPFAGYVRGSVQLAESLLATGWLPLGAGTAATKATMLEAYPGGTWKLLAGRRLPPKNTIAGAQARLEVLIEQGLRFSQAPRTHDELDAALCGWLGWLVHHEPSRVEFVGRRWFQSSGRMREGAILQVALTADPFRQRG